MFSGKILWIFLLTLLQCEFFVLARKLKLKQEINSNLNILDASRKTSRSTGSKVAEYLVTQEEDFVNILEGFIKDDNDDDLELLNDETNNTNKSNVPPVNENANHNKKFLLATKITKELAAGTASIQKFLLEPRKDKIATILPNFVSRFKSVTGVLGAVGAVFSIISLFLPKEESEVSKLNKKMVEEFKNVNRKLDNIGMKIDKLEDIIPYEVQRAQYISDHNMVVQARKQLTVLADLLLNVNCQDNKTCAIEKNRIIERYVNDVLQSEKLKLISAKLFSSISTTKGYFQENMLELVNKVYDCHVAKNNEFVQQVVGLTFQAHEVIIVSEVLQGNKAEIVEIVDQWINDLSLVEQKLLQVNEDCHNNMKFKIQEELLKRLKKYQNEKLEPQNATTRIFEFLEKKYEWVGWLVLQRPVLKDFLCTDNVFFEFMYSIDPNENKYRDVIIVEYLETDYNYAKDISETIIRKQQNMYRSRYYFPSIHPMIAKDKCDDTFRRVLNSQALSGLENNLIQSKMIIDPCWYPCRREPVHHYSKGISKHQFFSLLYKQYSNYNGSGILPPRNEQTIFVILKLSMNEKKKLHDTCKMNCLNGKCLSRPFTSKYFCVCNKEYHGEKCESKLRITLLKEINEILKIGMKIPRISDVFFGLKNLESKFDKQNQNIFKLQSSIDELTFSTAKNFNDLENLILLRFKDTESGINEIQKALSTAYEMYNKKIDNLEKYLGKRFDWVELKVLYSEAIYNLNFFIHKFQQGQKTGTSESKDFFKQFSASDISSSKLEKWMTKLHDLINGRKDDIELLTNEPILKLFINVYSRERCEKHFKALVDSQWSQLQLLQLNGYILWKEFLDFKNIDASFVNAKMKESITLQIETMKRITCNKIDVKYSTSAQCTGDEFGYALIDEYTKLECAFGFVPSKEKVSCDTYDQVECLSCYCSNSALNSKSKCPSKQQITNYYTKNSTCKFGYYPYISCTPYFHIECKSCYSALHKDLQARSKCPTDKEIRQHYLKNFTCNTGTYAHIPIDDESDIECRRTNEECDNVYKQWKFCQCNSAGNWNSYIPRCHFEEIYQCANYLRQRFGGESLPLFNNKDCNDISGTIGKCVHEIYRDILRTDDLDFWKFYVLIFGFNDFFHENMPRKDWKSILSIMLYKAYSKGYNQACRYGYYIAGKDFNFGCRSCYSAFHFNRCARSSCPSDDDIKLYYYSEFKSCRRNDQYFLMALDESQFSSYSCLYNTDGDCEHTALTSYNDWNTCKCRLFNFNGPYKQRFSYLWSNARSSCSTYLRQKYGGQRLPHYKEQSCNQENNECCAPGQVACRETRYGYYADKKSCKDRSKYKELEYNSVHGKMECHPGYPQSYEHLDNEKYKKFWREIIEVYGFDDFVLEKAGYQIEIEKYFSGLLNEGKMKGI